jgi:hypothetical protein
LVVDAECSRWLDLVDRPDLVIELIWTSGEIDEFEILPRGDTYDR